MREVRFVAVLAVLLVVATLAGCGGAGGDGLGDPLLPSAPDGPAEPAAFNELSAPELVGRAALAYSHVLYAKSPGGAEASAERTAAWREQIDEAAGGSETDAETVEAMVLLESAGRPDVSAGGTPDGASGLGQILPSTATDLLGMEVDLAESKRLSKKIARAEKKGRVDRIAELRRRRREVDERFDPEKALAGTVQYLEIALDHFGREDLAIASYHMGIGNTESVIRAYTGESEAEITDVVSDDEISYAKLFFGSSPRDHTEAWELLYGFGDDSSTYLWRVLAAREIMRLWREEPDELERTAELQTAKATAEELYHPPEETEVFEDPDDIADALDDGTLVEIPDGPDLGYAIGPQLGKEAEELAVERDRYLALRPEAQRTLTYIADLVREISGSVEPLILTSAVRDETYQDRLRDSNPEATDGYSLHTTGYSFDILREYESNEQARAFQFALDRLRALTVIDWAREPRAIHITTGPGAEDLTD